MIMAKEDFCFTYYDGDATRDTSHMNRLQRGGYHDLVIGQRKFGRMRLDQIKMILGQDFDQVWPPISMVMKSDGEFYYIEWLDNSIEKMRLHSHHQSVNGRKGGRPPKNNPNESESKPNGNPNESDPLFYINPNQSEKKPLEDGDGNEDTGLKEGGAEETNQGAIIPSCMKLFTEANPQYPVDSVLDYPSVRLIAGKIHKWLGLPGQITDEANRDAITRRWGEMIVYIKSDQHLSGYSIMQINKYFQTIAQGLFGKNGTNINQHRDSKPGKQAGSKRILESLRSDLNAGGKQYPLG